MTETIRHYAAVRQQRRLLNANDFGCHVPRGRFQVVEALVDPDDNSTGRVCSSDQDVVQSTVTLTYCSVLLLLQFSQKVVSQQDLRAYYCTSVFVPHQTAGPHSRGGVNGFKPPPKCREMLVTWESIPRQILTIKTNERFCHEISCFDSRKCAKIRL